MRVFLVKRLAWGVLVLLLVAVLTFFLSRVVPADPAAFLAGQNASEETVAAHPRRVRPRPAADGAVRRAIWRASPAAISASRSAPTAAVAADLAQFLPATLELLVVSFVLYLASASSWPWRRRAGPAGRLDSTIRLLTMLGTGIPVFWLGMALQFVFFYKLHWLPLGGRFPIRDMPPPDDDGLPADRFAACRQLQPPSGSAALMMLPALTIVINLLAVGTRLSRAALIEEYGKLYVRTARGKGLGPRHDPLQARAAQRAEPDPHRHHDAVRLHDQLGDPGGGDLRLAGHRPLRLPVVPGVRLCAGDRAGDRLDRRLRASSTWSWTCSIRSSTRASGAVAA